MKGDPGILSLAEGVVGNVQGKPEAESCEVSDLHDPEDPESRSPRGQSTWRHSDISLPVLAEPDGGLLQTPLGDSCSPWSLSAALGKWAACECVQAGRVKEVEKVEKV